MRKKGFTLIELLVVISIIALLLSILMPALSKVKDQAKAVVCKSNLKQWGIVVATYTSQNNEAYPEGDITDWDTMWFGAFWDIISEQNDFAFTKCPVAKQPNLNPADMDPVYMMTPGSPTLSWVLRDNALWDHGQFEGSYGWNSWAANPDPSVQFQWGTMPTSSNWKKATASRANTIPIMFDSTISSEWFTTANLYDETIVNPDLRGGGVFAERHVNNKYGNVVFMDGSVSSVGLKGMFKLKWNRVYDTTQDPLVTTSGATPAPEILEFPDDIR